MLVAGCAAPSTPTPTSPTGAAPPPSAIHVTPPPASVDDGNTSSAPDATPQPAPAAGGENEDMRVKLANHTANQSATSISFDLLDKSGHGILVHYAYLRSQNGSHYFEFESLVPAGEERRISSYDDSGSSDDRLSPWVNMTFYYTRAPGAADSTDGILVLDLVGRGPS